MVLPVTLDLHEDEAPISFVARLAAANGFSSLQRFVDHTDTTADAIVRGKQSALKMVSQWSSLPLAKVGHLASISEGAGLTWRLGQATLSKDMRAGRMLRFCPHCVLDDLDAESGRIVSRPYQRAWWSVRGIEGCHIHGRRLTEVAMSAAADHLDFPRYVEANIVDVQQAASRALPGSQPRLDRHLVDRIFSPAGSGFLAQLDAHVVSEFSRYLGDFLVLHEVKDRMLDSASPTEWGFVIADEGEAAIRDVFAEVIDRSPPNGRRVETVLGPMALWLRRNLDKDAYQPVVDLVQDILERNMPFGPGQKILKPVMVRHLYCVNSASMDYGLMKDRVRSLMAEHYPGFRSGLADAQTYFDATAARPILQAATETLTSAEARTVLGIKEERMRDLLDAGIVEQVEIRSGEERAFVRISKVALDALISRLTDSMVVVGVYDGLMTLSAAARSWRKPYHDVVSKILDGSLAAFCVAGDEPVLLRARVQKDGLMVDVRPTAGGDENWMRLKEVEQALGTTTATVNALIERGYLRMQNIRRETGRTVKLVERQSVTGFQSAYLSLSDIAKSTNGYRAKIKASLDQLNVAPIFEPEGFVARFYSRSEINEVGLEL